jgi:hypothetical protein
LSKSSPGGIPRDRSELLGEKGVSPNPSRRLLSRVIGFPQKVINLINWQDCFLKSFARALDA